MLQTSLQQFPFWIRKFPHFPSPTLQIIQLDNFVTTPAGVFYFYVPGKDENIWANGERKTLGVRRKQHDQ